MGSSKYVQQAGLATRQSWWEFPVRRALLSPWACQRNSDRPNNRDAKRNRYRKYLSALIAICVTPTPAFANNVGGVSATANPIAQSSSSVQNQAIQVLQGPYINSAVTAGVQCQGPTLNITPFVTHSHSYQIPFETLYQEPVYDSIDIVGAFDEDGNAIPDGIPDNGWGSVAYYKPVRTGQKNSNNLNLGLSATVSFPLDGGIQERCKAAMSTQNKIQEQILANKALDYTLARLRHCGELSQKGIQFAPSSPFFTVCSDVIAKPKRVSIAPHKHEVTITPSDLGLDESAGSLNVEPESAPSAIGVSPFSP